VAQRAHVAHLSKRRLRLRCESGPDLARTAQALADDLASVRGVARIVVRPNTGSIIIDTLTDAAEVLDGLKAHSAIAIVSRAKPPPVGQVLQLGLLKADMDLGKRTDGALDLRTTIALLLIVGAVVQLARGKVAGPTTTLLMSAFSLLYKGPPR
jgi:hypothetical protein